MRVKTSQAVKCLKRKACGQVDVGGIDLNHVAGALGEVVFGLAHAVGPAEGTRAPPGVAEWRFDEAARVLELLEDAADHRS